MCCSARGGAERPSSPEALQLWLDEQREYWRDVHADVRGQECLRLTYERDFSTQEAQEATIGRIARFLGLAPASTLYDLQGFCM